MLVIPTQSGERLTGREGKQCGQEQKQLLKKDETFVSISPLTGKSDGLSVLDLLDKDKRQQNGPQPESLVFLPITSVGAQR